MSPIFTLYLFFLFTGDHRVLHSFPTRRSSDLFPGAPGSVGRRDPGSGPGPTVIFSDRKSTRLNSSHLGISYAVFCLKKKKNKKIIYVYVSKSHNQNYKVTYHDLHIINYLRNAD